MAKSCDQLTREPHFLLKCDVLVLGFVVCIILLGISTDPIANGYHISFLMLMIALVIASIIVETTIFTEISLLIATLIMLVVSTVHCSIHKCIPRYYWLTDTESLESSNHEYYAFIIINVTCMIIILVDILLRLSKK